jgi:Protein of unknown function (DUF642)/PEP-CTERM motif
MKSRNLIAAALAIGLLAIGDARADNLVINGGFESGFTGWNVQGSYLLVADAGKAGSTPLGGYGPHSGTFFAAMGSGQVGSLSQVIPTTAGQGYSLSFFLASDGSTPNSFGVTWGGQSILAQSVIAKQNYTLYTYQLAATSAATTLSFQEMDVPSYLSLDDVSVTAIPSTSSAPEPASLTLLAIGSLGVAGFAARRRRGCSA